jgi:hypothetical protein
MTKIAAAIPKTGCFNPDTFPLMLYAFDGARALTEGMNELADEFG